MAGGCRARFLQHLKMEEPWPGRLDPIRLIGMANPRRQTPVLRISGLPSCERWRPRVIL